MKLRLTAELAYAAGRDAGNRSMRAAGRAAWNEQDYDAAAAECNRLLQLVEHGLKHEENQHENGTKTDYCI